MVFDNEEPICAGWLFQTDCDMALIGSVISGKKVGKKKKDALKALFVCLENIAKTMGFQSIFFPVTTNSIARLAEKDLNYINTKQKANELIKFI